ncbi:hypothetical protein RRG08_019779 [Elysia crispata]|uniref:Uncharacterized protein n=1 Tax=Elysia crispata TaxID=231223 RepID=A0AAE1E5C8_9GAST|nr:hypothetical protein RRG08_019779 [Elysia crispata]
MVHRMKFIRDFKPVITVPYAIKEGLREYRNLILPYPNASFSPLLQITLPSDDIHRGQPHSQIESDNGISDKTSRPGTCRNRFRPKWNFIPGRAMKEFGSPRPIRQGADEGGVSRHAENWSLCVTVEEFAELSPVVSGE